MELWILCVHMIEMSGGHGRSAEFLENRRTNGEGLTVAILHLHIPARPGKEAEFFLFGGGIQRRSLKSTLANGASLKKIHCGRTRAWRKTSMEVSGSQCGSDNSSTRGGAFQDNGGNSRAMPAGAYLQRRKGDNQGDCRAPIYGRRKKITISSDQNEFHPLRLVVPPTQEKYSRKSLGQIETDFVPCDWSYPRTLPYFACPSPETPSYSLEAIDTKHDIIGRGHRRIIKGNYSEMLLAGGVTKRASTHTKPSLNTLPLPSRRIHRRTLHLAHPRRQEAHTATSRHFLYHVFDGLEHSLEPAARTASPSKGVRRPRWNSRGCRLARDRSMRSCPYSNLAPTGDNLVVLEGVANESSVAMGWKSVDGPIHEIAEIQWLASYSGKSEMSLVPTLLLREERRQRSTKQEACLCMGNMTVVVSSGPIANIHGRLVSPTNPTTTRSTCMIWNIHAASEGITGGSYEIRNSF
ncbi:hypothetical protein B0H13DRAFT_1910479 [Mycena leptocephala]|nr:hypothetical protein B0H13DRAFT_1910479 [Mycena leptocephala]